MGQEVCGNCKYYKQYLNTLAGHCGRFPQNKELVGEDVSGCTNWKPLTVNKEATHE